MALAIFPKFHDFSRPGKCTYKFHDFSQSWPCEPWTCCTSPAPIGTNTFEIMNRIKSNKGFIYNSVKKRFPHYILSSPILN